MRVCVSVRVSVCVLLPLPPPPLPSSSFLFRATNEEYGRSQARCPIRAAATGLRHSHSNTGYVTH